MLGSALLGIALPGTLHLCAQTNTSPVLRIPCIPSTQDTAFIPVDSWVYPSMLRLYSMGYLNSVFLGERPWTLASIARMLPEVAESIDESRNFVNGGTEEAEEIYAALIRELHYDPTRQCLLQQAPIHLDSIYSETRIISGTPLRDSEHLGSTFVNDYGRPYAHGINNYTGFSGTARVSRFQAYLRGEFQETPGFTGYATSLSQYLSETVDQLTYINPSTGQPYYQATIPDGRIADHRSFNPLEAYISTHALGHEISFGRKDEWLSPAQGGAFAYSNNAENLYALHIDRVDPLYVPGLSRLFGPFRYEFIVGEMQGHTYMTTTSGGSIINWPNPGKPWMHLEKVAFKPTPNFEVSFERTAIWGGHGHEAINLHTFLRSFFSVTAASPNEKNSNKDPGSRYGAFTLSYRVPYARNWLTVYVDGEAHDDVCSCDAPRRASWRPGFYLSHFPREPKLDLRAEVVWTDPPITNSKSGQFMYWENMDRQGYTNKGQIFGDWIGREDKGGQAWMSYHLTGSDMVQLSVRHQKAAQDFIASGTTLNDLNVSVSKKLNRQIDLNSSLTWEKWKIPVLATTAQTSWTSRVQILWTPDAKQKSR